MLFFIVMETCMWRVPQNCLTKTDILGVVPHLYIYIFLFFLDPVTNICTSIRILFFINNYFLACNYFLVRMFKYQISSHKCYWYFSPILGHNFSGTFYFHKIIRCSSNSSQTENNRNIISKGQMRSIPNCVL